MNSFKTILERFFRARDRLLEKFSARWQAHANRRTSIIVIVAALFVTLAYLFFIEPPVGFPLHKLVTIDDGASLSQVARSLQQAQVVRSAIALEVVVTAMGKEHAVRSGDYLFKEPQNLFEVARTISTGAYGLDPIRFRIMEGMTVTQMAKIFSLELERFNTDRFLREAKSQEGYLFPDTYFFLPNASDELIVKTMRQNFDAKIAPLLPAIASSTRSLADIITMASILEREAHTTDDRKKIAGVLWNRLTRGMPLQVDAVFLYTLGKNTFQLTIEDLQTDGPYNTYTRKGLPPTPIGNPSMDSIMAALYPEKSSYFYYLADKSGTTHYSKTYAEHLQKKALYLSN